MYERVLTARRIRLHTGPIFLPCSLLGSRFLMKRPRLASSGRFEKSFRSSHREYEIVVYDDASTDATADILQPYTNVLPLTVIRGDTHVGYGRALDAVCRTVARQARSGRRDALITMQGDFHRPAEHLPDLVKRFEGGADIVVVERPASQLATLPTAVRRFRRVAPWVLRPFVR